MSLINLLNEQTREKEKSDLKNTSRTFLSAIALGGAGYLANEKLSLKSNVKKSYGILKNSTASNELGEAGKQIRSDADALKVLLDANKKDLLTKFKNTILSQDNLDEMFSGSGNIEDARAFLAAIFDSATESTTDDSGTLRASIEALYEGVGKGTITDQDKQIVMDFYKSSIETSGKRLQAFKKSYSTMQGVAGQFDSVAPEFTTAGTRTKEWQVFKPKDLTGAARNKYDELVRMTSGKPVGLVSIDEFDQAGKPSIYARVEHSNGRIQNVALHLQSDKATGNTIIRGTSNLSTRYTTAGGIIDARKLFPNLNLDRLILPATGGSTAAFDAATVSLDDHLFEMLRNNKNGLQNFNTRNINQYNDYIRSMSIETPRTMIEGMSAERNGRHLVDPELRGAIASSRKVQSMIHKIVGLESFAAKDRDEITKRILQYAPDIYGGPSSSQTLNTRFTNPFNLKQDLIVGNVERLVENDKATPTAFNIMKRYGQMDRGMLPQTARGAQLHGRPELTTGFVGLKQDATFGRGGGIKVSGAGSDLIGVTSGDVGKHARGVNFGAIMLFNSSSNAKKLGLGEGMAYLGGTVQIKKGISKTVNRESLAQSNLMRELLLAASDNNRKFLTIGSKIDGDDYDIDEFFRKYGDSKGRAILGRQDDRFVHIKKHKGMRRFTLGVAEKSTETGRDRYHIVGDVDQDVSHGKLFGVFTKDTNLTISQQAMKQKLSALGLNDVGTAFFDADTFGGKIANTLLTTTAQVEKSATFLRTQIHGGMRMLGMNDSTLDKLLNDKLGDTSNPSKLLAEINSQISDSANHLVSLDQATKTQRQASTLGLFFESAAKGAGTLNEMTAEKFSMVMSLAYHQADETKKPGAQFGDYGLNLKYFKNKISAGLKQSGLKDPEITSYLEATEKMASRGVVIGAAGGISGTPHTDLARNTAKAEPRFANYLYTSLRSFWGMDAKEATNYISSLMLRMEGFEDRAAGLLGMKVSQESLGMIDPKNIQDQLSGIKDIRQLSSVEVSDLLDLGQGEERAVVEKLSEAKGGNIINLEEIGLSKKALDKLHEKTGGKKEIFLPGEDTFKGFIGHEIKSAQETIKIEAEYSRGVNDLLSSLSGLKTAGDDEGAINNAIEGFTSVRKSLSKVAGAAIRGSLAGRILGSGSYMGGGFTLGKTAGEGTIFSDLAPMNAKIHQGLSEVVNEKMGYVAFMDQQAFLDGMSTYESALTKSASQRSVSTKAETSRLMLETIKDFFLGMHRSIKTGVSATIGRNPMMGFGHLWGGMGVYQYDFTENIKALDLLRRSSKRTEWTPAYRGFLESEQAVRRASLVDDAIANSGDSDLQAHFKTEADRTAYLDTNVARGKKIGKISREALTANDEAFWTARTALKEQEDEIFENQMKTFYNKNMEFMKGTVRSTSHMGVLSDELEAAHTRRVHKVDSLKKQITSLSAKIRTDENYLKSVKDINAMNSEDFRALDGIGKQRAAAIIAERNKGEFTGFDDLTNRVKLGSGAKSLRTGVSTANQIKQEKAALQKNKALEADLKQQLKSTEIHVAKAEKNVAKYGREVIRPSNANFERSTTEIFRKTMEELGEEYSPGKAANLTDSQLITANYNKATYTHFEDRKAAVSFLNRVGGFYGFTRSTGSETGTLYKPTIWNEINQELGYLTDTDNVLENRLTKSTSTTENSINSLRLRMDQPAFNERLKSLRSEDSFLSLNTMTKDELQTIKGIGPAKAQRIIDARTAEKFSSWDDLKTRVPGIGPAFIERVKKGASLRSTTPDYSDIHAFERLIHDDPSLYEEDLQGKGYAAAQKEQNALQAQRKALEGTSAGVDATKRSKAIEDLKKQQTKPTKNLTALKAIEDTITSDSLADIHAENLTYTGAREQAADPGAYRNFAVLEDRFGTINTGEDLENVERQLAAMSDDELEYDFAGKGTKYNLKEAFNATMLRLPKVHAELGEVGGGMVRFPQIDIKMNLVNTQTKKVSAYEGRMDFTRFGIGDYDADPYQVFFDTDKTLKKKIAGNLLGPEKMVTYGAEFLSTMHLLGEGMGQLGKRMGANKMTVAESIVDEYAKERIVKGVGGLDVQVKAGMLGLAQAAAEDSSGDFAEQFKRVKTGAALISVAQEVLGLKGKKLPIAADISKEYLTALKTSFGAGEATALKTFFKEKIFKDTILDGSNANLKIDPKSIEFLNTPEGKLTNAFRSAMGNANLNIDEIFESLDIMARNVKKHGWDKFTSSSRIGRALEGSERMNANQLFELLGKGSSMEGGVITGEMEAIEDIFSRAEAARGELAANLGRSGKGLAGMLAGGLLASYAIGANQNIGSLEPGGKFSDMQAKAALSAGESLSQRAVQQNFSKEHRQPSPGSIAGADNFYERPINSGETSVSLNRSIRMFGEAPNLSAAQTMGKHFVSSGGHASLTINDTRQPLGAAYINKMMRD
jgi:DNA uptake protein ComE-like DNA-binding protein